MGSGWGAGDPCVNIGWGTDRLESGWGAVRLRWDQVGVSSKWAGITTRTTGSE